MAVAPPASKTLADAAYKLIREDIISGALKPSEKLKFTNMVTRYEFGVSPLREALARLSSDHLVLLEGQRGFTVAPASREELLDVSRVRQLVEAEAVALSIKNGNVEWEAGIVAAYFRLQRAEERREENSMTWVQEWESCNNAFHAALISHCGSVWLLRLQELLYAQHKRYRFISLQHPRDHRDLNAEHKALMEACLNRDIARARQLTAEHIEKTVNSVAELLPADNTPIEAPRGRSSKPQQESAR
jgi:GntR family transcriptional regulator, carbon starvation induced regulator